LNKPTFSAPIPSELCPKQHLATLIFSGFLAQQKGPGMGRAGYARKSVVVLLIPEQIGSEKKIFKSAPQNFYFDTIFSNRFYVLAFLTKIQTGDKIENRTHSKSQNKIILSYQSCAPK
jgi:hypothetical protein